LRSAVLLRRVVSTPGGVGLVSLCVPRASDRFGVTGGMRFGYSRDVRRGEPDEA